MEGGDMNTSLHVLKDLQRLNLLNGEEGGGGGGNQERFIWGGFAMRFKPIPFYIPFMTHER